jgi:hypothetical protein
MNHRYSLRRGTAVATAFFLLALPPLCPDETPRSGKTKTERFDADPGWDGVNHRLAREREPATIRQDFGYSTTRHAGGRRGELGGYITPAGEAAYYARRIAPASFKEPLSASGTLSCPDGAFHVLLGFFSAATVNEWRTPSTIALRLNGRGDHFYAYVEYCTSRWRAGGDTTPFPSRPDPATGRLGLIGYPSGGKVHRWTLSYAPAAGSEPAVVTATIGGDEARCIIDPEHLGDGARFDRFGVLNVVKSADGGGEIYFDDITVNGERESFDEDPGWESRNNRRTYTSSLVRPRFDFGFSPTSFAGGKAAGELGGVVFRGDCRWRERLAAYGDAVGPLSLDRPFHASGKVVLRRGVSDSTTLFGFYHSEASLRQNPSQSHAVPESVAGIQIEGPSSEGFCFYPVYRPRGGGGRSANPREAPRILPDGASHDWSLVYDPEEAGGRGRITVALDGRSIALDLEPGVKEGGTLLDRFGIVTTWIDGNSQEVYWDDLTYTVAQ